MAKIHPKRGTYERFVSDEIFVMKFVSFVGIFRQLIYPIHTKIGVSCISSVLVNMRCRSVFHVNRETCNPAEATLN